tara:strand:- start:101 stop:253 length:153 start_codon:yes stop_codon:yes gene_type:complete
VRGKVEGVCGFLVCRGDFETDALGVGEEGGMDVEGGLLELEIEQSVSAIV